MLSSATPVRLWDEFEELDDEDWDDEEELPGTDDEDFDLDELEEEVEEE